MSSKTTNYVTSGPIEVPQQMQHGEKFIKWEDDSQTPTPVTMRVDAHGFYIHWIDQKNEFDILDIATIRDVRTGRYAKKPKDNKLRQLVSLGSVDTLEDKTVTICYGNDMVNLTFVNFCCTKKEIAQTWTDTLMRLAYSLTMLNGSTSTFLKKAHVKLCLQADKAGKIPIKSIIKMFAQNKDDKKRVEKALEVTGLPSEKIDTCPLSKFQFEDFYNLYKNLTQRHEVEHIFDGLVGHNKRKLMTSDQLVEFLNKVQRDPRLNEILHPYANTDRAREIIYQYEPNKFNAQKGQLSLDGFLRYLMSDDNPIMAPNKYENCDDMDQPMSHYFINSSHNTYLTGHQLTGRSSVEMYRQCLLAGCRCVELDLWNGKSDEPVIVHGYTLVAEIVARDVLEAIAETAFKTSDYPVILSFENHCNPKYQAKIAKHCRDIFGDMLLDSTLDSHPLEPFVELPPPSMLRRKIIIKNKKKHHHHHHHNHDPRPASASLTSNRLTAMNSVDAAPAQAPVTDSSRASAPPAANITATGSSATATSGTATTASNGNDGGNHAPPLQQQGRQESSGSSDTDSSSDEDATQNISQQATAGIVTISDKARKETVAGAEISALVNYVQPVHFSSFEIADRKGRYYEMSSFDEKVAANWLKERPIEFVNYNKHQLSRIYPAATRFDSSNFMPQLFWNAGCQLVALNFQVLDLAMQLNLGIFEYNARCGFLLKPEFMRRADRRFDPFAESTIDGIIAGTVSITVLSAQFLSEKRASTYVEVDMVGLPADTVRKRFRTKTCRDNGINPVYGNDPFVFKKVVLPQLSSLRIVAYEENGKQIGHRVLSVTGLCPGYRHVNLRNDANQPLPLATLFLYITVNDYVPDDMSNFAEALANPIKYQNELEKRDKQMAVLTEGTEPTPLEEDEEVAASAANDEEQLCKPAIAQEQQHEKPKLSAPASVEVQVTRQPSESNVSVKATTALQPAQVEQPPEETIPEGTVIIPELELVEAEPLEKIFETKAVREKRLELEKKLDGLRKKHDKEKIKVVQMKADSSKRPKFNIAHKLIKRLSSLNLEPGFEVPPCPADLGQDYYEESNTSARGAAASQMDNGDAVEDVVQQQQRRLVLVCREFSTQRRELFEKYHDIIYMAADKAVKASQTAQMKQLKVSYELGESDVLRQVNDYRRARSKAIVIETANGPTPNETRARKKVALEGCLITAGVVNRQLLDQAFYRRREALQGQHDAVRMQLSVHRSKAREIMDMSAELKTCDLSNGFLRLFECPPSANGAAIEGNPPTKDHADGRSRSTTQEGIISA